MNIYSWCHTHINRLWCHTHLGVHTPRWQSPGYHTHLFQEYMFAQFLDTQVLQMLIWTLLTLRCSLHSQKDGLHSLTCHSHAFWATELSFRCAHQTVHMLVEPLLTSTQIPHSKCGRHSYVSFPFALLMIPMLNEIQGKTCHVGCGMFPWVSPSVSFYF